MTQSGTTYGTKRNDNIQLDFSAIDVFCLYLYSSFMHLYKAFSINKSFFVDKPFKINRRTP